MVEYETKIKHWGNSFGIVVPKEQLQKDKIKENQMVRVIIKPVKKLKARDIFGKLKQWKRPTEGIIKTMDKELDSKFLGE